ncbi:MAG: caspase family protein [Prosthecobacter sp.]|uniref:caspase family protein n=1 Tax=Prosthecobacter sp. TaxID=1965333 RepID=UPI0039007CC3
MISIAKSYVFDQNPHKIQFLQYLTGLQTRETEFTSAFIEKMAPPHKTNGFEHGHALLIGVSKTSLPKFSELSGARNDVGTLAHHLVDPARGAYRKKQVAVLKESSRKEQQPTRENITKELQRLAIATKPQAKERTVWIHFSGHGFTRDGQEYLVTADAQKADDAAMPMTEFMAEVAKIPAARKILCFDCCRSEMAQARTSGAEPAMGGPTEEQLKNLARGSGTLILYATSPKEAAWEDARGKKGALGLLTQAVVEATCGGDDIQVAEDDDGLLSCFAFCDYVTKRVPKLAQDAEVIQTPQLEINGGRFSICYYNGGGKKERGAVPELTPENIALWGEQDDADGLASTKSQKDQRVHPICLTGGGGQYAIRVRTDGTLAGPYYEGTYGCVIGLYEVNPDTGGFKDTANASHQPKQPAAALKLPIMLADSLVENEHIADVLYKELACMTQAKPHIQSTDCLLKPQDGATAAGKMQMGQLPQNGSVLFVTFSREGPPRIVAIKPNWTAQKEADARFIVFPSGGSWSALKTKAAGQPEDATQPSKPDEKTVWSLESVTDEGNETWPQHTKLLGAIKANGGWAELEKIARDGNREFATIVVEPEERRDSKRSTLNDAARAERTDNRWFVGLPSVLVEWCPSSLQQLIAKSHSASGTGQPDSFRHWSFAQHGELWHRMSTALSKLHTLGILHGDIRPANIFCEKEDSSDPKHYKLGDYGGFGQAPVAATATTAKFEMSLGIPLANHRDTPFYASERGQGEDCEEADVAYVYPAVPEAEADSDWIIRLGWDNELGKAADLAQQTRELLATTHHAPAADFRPGDYLHIRGLLFKIKAAVRCQGDQSMAFCCDHKFFKVLFNRVPEPGDGGAFLREPRLAIPRYTHHRQWSTATDVYSLGGTDALHGFFQRY